MVNIPALVGGLSPNALYSPILQLGFHVRALFPPTDMQSKREWESDSGRTLTLKDTEMGKLSKVELLALQRVAINQLQSMNIPVSHALMGGT